MVDSGAEHPGAADSDAVLPGDSDVTVTPSEWPFFREAASMMELPKRHAISLHGQPVPVRVAAVHARSELEGATVTVAFQTTGSHWHDSPAAAYK